MKFGNDFLGLNFGSLIFGNEILGNDFFSALRIIGPSYGGV